jgi:hypothetical protein
MPRGPTKRIKLYGTTCSGTASLTLGYLFKWDDAPAAGKKPAIEDERIAARGLGDFAQTELAVPQDAGSATGRGRSARPVL